ncbi:MAG: DNA-3-methyladenine glycosylase I [Burkholderiaceae bacterium]|nr:DNA-3-methyladenine glycosylase I [Burkholderiaceae bacterium]
MNKRCRWCTDDPLYIQYHDEEWGVPAHDDRHLFEMLTLEGAQAGLSWITVLRKREHYRAAFDGFNIKRVAAYGEDKIASLLSNPGLIRNRAKIQSTVNNAKAVLAVQKEYGSFDAFLWTYVDGKPIQNARQGGGDIPASTELSDRMSKDLKNRGFGFVGSTICYAFMQATGMVNDHEVGCPQHKAVRKLGK